MESVILDINSFDAISKTSISILAYHGTNDCGKSGEGIVEFHNRFSGSKTGNLYKGRPIFFSSDASNASSYANSKLLSQLGDDRRDYGGTIYPCVLNFKNVLVVDANGEDFTTFVRPSINKAVRNGKYDGVIIRNIYDTHRMVDGGKEILASTIAVLNPACIVSAISGQGVPSDILLRKRQVELAKKAQKFISTNSSGRKYPKMTL